MTHDRYRIIDKTAPHFLTATVVNWLPLFTNPTVKQELLDSLRFLQQRKRLTVYAYVIMEHHIHLAASSPDLSKEMGDFKSYTARRIIDYYRERETVFILKQLAFHKRPYKVDRTYQLWQEGSHPQQIDGLKMMRQKVEYIHNNPVKRGWVDKAIDWRYSSARNYVGQEGLLDVRTEW